MTLLWKETNGSTMEFSTLRNASFREIAQPKILSRNKFILYFS